MGNSPAQLAILTLSVLWLGRQVRESLNRTRQKKRKHNPLGMSTIRYREAYEQLGDERVQKAPDSLAKVVESKNEKSFFTSEAEVYWSVRKDYNWSKIPGNLK